MEIRRRGEIRAAAANGKVTAKPAEIVELVDAYDSLKLAFDKVSETGALLTAVAGGAEIDVPDIQFPTDYGVFRSYPILMILKAALKRQPD